MKWLKTQLINLSILCFALIGLTVVSWPGFRAEAAPAYVSAIKTESISITTTGSAGSATGTATTGATICGQVLRVDVDYSASAPSTADLTLKEVSDQIDTNIVTKSNSATDAQYYPTVQLTANDGTARTMDGTRPLVDYYPVCDELIATLAQSDALTPSVTIAIYYKE